MNIKAKIDPFRIIEWAYYSQLDPLALTLSRLVAAKINFCKCNYQVMVSGRVKEIDMYDFDHGGKIDGGFDVDLNLLETIDGLLGEDYHIVAEDWTNTPGSDFILNNNIPAKYFGKEVYYIMKRADLLGHEKWRRMFFNNVVPLFHGFAMTDVDTILINELAGLEFVDYVSDRVKLIYMGIYDGESYMICSVRE